jgi:hypothetical protein
MTRSPRLTSSPASGSDGLTCPNAGISRNTIALRPSVSRQSQHRVSVRFDHASQLLGRSNVGVVALAVEHHTSDRRRATGRRSTRPATAHARPPARLCTDRRAWRPFSCLAGTGDGAAEEPESAGRGMAANGAAEEPESAGRGMAATFWYRAPVSIPGWRIRITGPWPSSSARTVVPSAAIVLRLRCTVMAGQQGHAACARWHVAHWRQYACVRSRARTLRQGH